MYFRKNVQYKLTQFHNFSREKLRLTGRSFLYILVIQNIDLLVFVRSFRGNNMCA